MRAIWALNLGDADERLATYAYARRRTLHLHVRTQNQTPYRCVTSYVCNEGRTATYILDPRSGANQQYDVSWEITAAGARLLHPSGLTPIQSFSGLAARGLLP